jgi:hypothetical protein
MRYASFVACLIVLLVVGSVAVHYGAKRFAFARVIKAQEVDDALADLERRERWPIGNLPWVVLLALAPLIIVGVAKNRGLEHIPAWSGVLYLFIVLIAIDVDQRFSPTGQKLELRNLRFSWVSVACLLASVAMIWISLGYDWQESVCDEWSRAVVWCTAGFALLALALHRLSADQTELFRTESPRPFLVALALALGVVAATYLVLLAGMSLGTVAILELTTLFWIWAIAASAAFSILLMILATVRTAGGPRFPAINRGVGLLFSRHPSRRWIVGRRRLGRFVLYGLAGWLWWNLVAAPGLYGNCDAREYFERTYGSFLKQTGRGSGPLALSVPFVVTATSLQMSQERYFLFPRMNGGEQGGIQSDVWFRLVSDPRWLVVSEFTDLDLQNVAFASGSPFPVFSSHKVTLPSLQFDEKFIDGGFAHNRPLDAARALGARRVLVLNSSPLSGGGRAGKCRLGELACNLPKLIPYLWERSQTEDNLSSVTMFVASIYPTPMDGRSWPMLTDFHGDVVDTMVRVADEDAVRRIGVVESWGAPKLEDARMLVINLSQVDRKPQPAQ